MYSGTNCQVIFATNRSPFCQPLGSICVHTSATKIQQTESLLLLYGERDVMDCCEVNQNCTSDCSTFMYGFIFTLSFKLGTNVKFSTPDLKVSRFQRPKYLHPVERADRHIKNGESKCIPHLVLPTHSAKSQAATQASSSNLTENLAGGSASDEDIKATAQTETGVRVSFQTQTVTYSGGTLSVEYLGEEGSVPRSVSCLFPHLSLSAREQRADERPAPPTTPWLLPAAP